MDWHELKGFWELEDETETKKDEPITVVAKMTEYYSDGSVGYQHEYEYITITPQ